MPKRVAKQITDFFSKKLRRTIGNLNDSFFFCRCCKLFIIEFREQNVFIEFDASLPAADDQYMSRSEIMHKNHIADPVKSLNSDNFKPILSRA